MLAVHAVIGCSYIQPVISLTMIRTYANPSCEFTVSVSPLSHQNQMNALPYCPVGSLTQRPGRQPSLLCSRRSIGTTSRVPSHSPPLKSTQHTPVAALSSFLLPDDRLLLCGRTPTIIVAAGQSYLGPKVRDGHYAPRGTAPVIRNCQTEYHSNLFRVSCHGSLRSTNSMLVRKFIVVFGRLLHVWHAHLSRNGSIPNLHPPR